MTGSLETASQYAFIEHNQTQDVMHSKKGL